jgi:predicted DCC family thiol-disulfide oxidoreductase YuxK
VTTSNDDELIVLYDGTCGFCRWSVQKLRARFDLTGQLVPSQSFDIASVGLTREQVEQAAWVVSQNGVVSGADAGAVWLSTGNRQARVISRIMTARPVRPVARIAYRVVAHNRHRIPGPWERTCSVS